MAFDGNPLAKTRQPPYTSHVAVTYIKYICTLALRRECFEICHHMRPHRAGYGCEYETCLNKERRCVPFSGTYDVFGGPVEKERRR